MLSGVEPSFIAHEDLSDFFEIGLVIYKERASVPHKGNLHIPVEH